MVTFVSSDIEVYEIVHEADSIVKEEAERETRFSPREV